MRQYPSPRWASQPRRCSNELSWTSKPPSMQHITSRAVQRQGRTAAGCEGKAPAGCEGRATAECANMGQPHTTRPRTLGHGAARSCTTLLGVRARQYMAHRCYSGRFRRSATAASLADTALQEHRNLPACRDASRRPWPAHRRSVSGKWHPHPHRHCHLRFERFRMNL